MKKTMQMRMLKSPNPRIHYMLFQANSPFRARTVENKRQFQRHEKHRNQSQGD